MNNGAKFSHLVTVRAEGAEPLNPTPTPCYGQPDHKISVFFLEDAREPKLYSYSEPKVCNVSVDSSPKNC